MKEPFGEHTEAVWDPYGFRTPAAQLGVILLYGFFPPDPRRQVCFPSQTPRIREEHSMLSLHAAEGPLTLPDALHVVPCPHLSLRKHRYPRPPGTMCDGRRTGANG